jgi:hypothetical protein
MTPVVMPARAASPGVSGCRLFRDGVRVHERSGYPYVHLGGSMDLAFGTNVREHFYTIGRLAGLEADRMTHAVRNILVKPDSDSGTTEERRPLAAVPADHFDGDIDLRSFPEGKTTPAADGVMLTDATRLMCDGKEIGHLAGVEIDPETGQIVSVIGRHHWWTPRLHLEGSTLDFTVPGEIRVSERSRDS